MTAGIVDLPTGKPDLGTAEALDRERAMANDDPATPVPVRRRGSWVLDLLGQADHPLGIEGE